MNGRRYDKRWYRQAHYGNPSRRSAIAPHGRTARHCGSRRWRCHPLVLSAVAFRSGATPHFRCVLTAHLGTRLVYGSRVLVALCIRRLSLASRGEGSIARSTAYSWRAAAARHTHCSRRTRSTARALAAGSECGAVRLRSRPCRCSLARTPGPRIEGGLTRRCSRPRPLMIASRAIALTSPTLSLAHWMRRYALPLLSPQHGMSRLIRPPSAPALRPTHQSSEFGLGLLLPARVEVDGAVFVRQATIERSRAQRGARGLS